MNQESLYRFLSTSVYHSAPVPLNLYIHLSKATYARPQLCLLLEQSAMQISSSTCPIPIHWVIINMETLLPPSKPLFSWLHPLSYVSFLCSFKSTSTKRVFYAASKFFSPILSWIHSSQVYNPITLLNLINKVTDNHHALEFNSQFSILILVNLSVIFSSFTSESKKL